MVGECLEVLDDGSEVELVACTGKAAQPHTLEAVVCLQVRKAHLDLLALVTGFGELRCTHQGARRIACVLMHVARDLSEGHIRGALGLERTWTAVAGARAMRADVEVALPIEGKVRARQDAFFPLAHVPNRDVRCDPGADNPMEELASAVCRLVFEFETAEPAIAEMKFDLLAQPPLEADAIAVADDEHSDHQLRVDRGSADVAVERRKLLAKVSQHPRHGWIDAP